MTDNINIAQQPSKHNPVLAIARVLVENTVPVLRCCTGLKTPHRNGEGTWDTCHTPERLEDWLHLGDNLAVLLGQMRDSPVLAIGLDVYKDRSIIDFAKELGVTTKANVWAQQTGRGGYTLIYYSPDVALKRNTLEKGSAIDLLVNSYTLIAPSDTSKETQGGGPYTWLPGRSPLDISLAELDTPPKDLLVWWQSLSTPKLPDLRDRTGAGSAPEWLTGPIYEHSRNTTLTKRAGYYHRMIPNDDVVRNLVHAANRADCTPPLSDRDVDIILNSILKREGAGHFRGVWPAKLEVRRG
jgi:hypothetical protein